MSWGESLTLQFDQMPPAALSPNSRLHFRRKAKIVKEWRELTHLTTMVAIQRQRIRGKWERAIWSPIFTWPDRRRRDEDNACSRCKPLLDGIVDAGLIPDDDKYHLERGQVIFEYDHTRPGGSLVIHLEERAP